MFQNRNFRNWIAVTKLTAQCDQPYRGAPGSSTRHGFDTRGAPFLAWFLREKWGFAPIQMRKPRTQLDPQKFARTPAAKRRKNAAHGASRGSPTGKHHKPRRDEIKSPRQNKSARRGRARLQSCRKGVKQRPALAAEVPRTPPLIPDAKLIPIQKDRNHPPRRRPSPPVPSRAR